MKKVSLVEELNLAHIESIEIGADGDGTFLIAKLSIPVPGFDAPACVEETFYINKKRHVKLRKAANSLFKAVHDTIKDGTNVKNNPCETCDSNCCFKWGDSIMVTHEDVERISENEPESFISAHFKKVANNIVLYGKAKTKMVGLDECCIFFDEKRMNCSIHKKKPQVCRVFSPYNCTEYQVDKEKLRKYKRKK
jgi:Fe-S-cluster containining protein